MSASIAKLLLFTATLTACAQGKASLVDEQDPAPVAAADELAAMYPAKLARAEALRDPATGWLVTDDDGALWTGLYAAAPGVTGVNLAAAEDPTSPGRLCRQPGPACWLTAGTDRTTWSRDMATGFLWGAWRTKDVPLLSRHAAYGVDHTWRMGDPLADGRVLYSPGIVGEVYQVLHALDASDSKLRLWPNAYTPGLDDYQAHIQVLGIMLRGEVDGVGPFGFAPDGDITRLMFDRLQEHAGREPEMPVYQVALGRYTGDQSLSVDLCKRGTVPADSFVRCHDFERCELAAWLFACGTLLHDLGKLPT